MPRGQKLNQQLDFPNEYDTRKSGTRIGICGVQRDPMSRLDDMRHAVLDRAERVLLKLDTQGYEMMVLQGAEKLLDRIVGCRWSLGNATL